MTLAQSNKAARGTKRVCQACQVRFYDLWRDPIMCPSCGAQHAPVVQPAVDAGRRATPVAGKTGWRQSTRRADAVPPVPDAESTASPEVAAAEELEGAPEEVANTSPEDDAVLEPEGDDSDFTGLVEIDVEHPKES
jgi:uncharacterized protein (TIGR02300 family)